MDRATIFQKIEVEREYQDQKWGRDFDNLNTPNDWVAYLTLYVGKAVTLPWDINAFRTAVLKVAAICVAILERNQYTKRHYDK